MLVFPRYFLGLIAFLAVFLHEKLKSTSKGTKKKGPEDLKEKAKEVGS
jgi:hypothetical protein